MPLSKWHNYFMDQFNTEIQQQKAMNSFIQICANHSGIFSKYHVVKLQEEWICTTWIQYFLCWTIRIDKYNVMLLREIVHTCKTLIYFFLSFVRSLQNASSCLGRAVIFSNGRKTTTEGQLRVYGQWRVQGGGKKAETWRRYLGGLGELKHIAEVVNVSGIAKYPNFDHTTIGALQQPQILRTDNNYHSFTIVVTLNCCWTKSC